MTKQEFIDGLVVALNATGDYRLINENRQFYTEYIDGEIAKGRTEEEVLNELGDPRLIANSILQASGYKDSSRQEEYTSQTTSNSNNNASTETDPEKQVKKATFKIKLIIGIIIFLLLAFIVLIITLGIGIIKFLWPVLFPILIVWLIVSLFKR